MKVEVLYMPDCPHHPRAVQELKKVLLAEGVAAKICEVAVSNLAAAEEFKFHGSPTIRINGQDVAGEFQEWEPHALACRVYPGAEEAGLSPIEMIRSAVRRAREGESA